MKNSENKCRIFYLYAPSIISFRLGYDSKIKDIRQFFLDKKMVYHTDVFGKAEPLDLGGYSQHIIFDRKYNEISKIYFVMPFSFVNRKCIYFDYNYYIEHGIKNIWYRLIKRNNIILNNTESDYYKEGISLCIMLEIY